MPTVQTTVDMVDPFQFSQFYNSYFQPGGTSTRFTTSNGILTWTVTGFGFTYTDGVPNAGTVTGISVAGISVTGLSMPLSDFYAAISTNSPDVFTAFIFAGNDTITGNGVSLYGYAGNDTINAGDGNDLVYGGAGSDTINGGNGSDLLYGGAGDDTIDGGAGVDRIYGGAGSDSLTGGAGADVFAWTLADRGTTAAPPTDTIADFNTAAPSAGGDVLDLRDLLSGEHAAGAGNLSNFIHFSTDGTSTTIQISTTGAFSGSNYGTATDQTIVLQNVNLFTGGLTTDQQILQDLLTKAKLVVDG